MPATDALLRAINEPETIRVVAAITTHAIREACDRQQARGIAAVVLGRALTAGALLATLGKGERERVRIQLQGGGPVGQVVVDAHGDGRVRACVATALSPTHLANRLLDVDPRPSTTGAVGARGHVTVTRDLGLAQPYQGSVGLRSGEIDEDLEHYLAHSEQLPSALRTAVILDQDGQVLRAAGVLAQGFPGSDPATVTQVGERLGGLRGLLLAHARELDELVGFALGGTEFRRMLEHPITFHCPCGPERALEVLTTLGPGDLEALADEQPQTEVRCNFCGQVTLVAATQVRDLAKQLRSVQS
ncbi:33 kDa chaperonin [Enhygromyxa salina]|uniref:33 kDa chaperonin n=1 Tax=Enhygromyxa salina TaxID=215803 RepID=A0A0C2D863_9BACT|nr:Hsp33 family molecular chaperone HslO [Enhygromyxa salina]KIG19321.1 33 kDa chaperonin [Enhygromyxa salina]